MAGRVYTSEELLSSVKLRGKVPNTDATGTADADILWWLNEQMTTEMVPFLMMLREDYFTVTTQITLVSGTSHYRIPTRAIGIKLDEIKYRSGTDATSDRDLPLISRENLDKFNASTVGPAGFYLEGNYIVMVPESANFTGTLIVSFFFRPGELVLSANYNTVASVNATNKTVTLTDAVNSGWSASSVFDIHSFDSGAEIKIWSETVSSVNTTTKVVTFVNEIDGSTAGTKAVAVGDYVVLENQAAVPALPRELHPVLAQSAVAAMKESSGDFDGAAIHGKRLDRMIQFVREQYTDRVESEPQIANNARSIWFESSFY